MNKLYLLFCFCLIIVLSCSSLFATGIGGYFTGSGGNASWKKWKKEISREYYYGGGIIIDATLSGNVICDYRLKIGAGSLTTQYLKKQPVLVFIDSVRQSRDYFYRVEMHAPVLAVSNTFGFELAKKGPTKFWVGPEILFEGIVGRLQGLYGGLGLMLGIDINITDYLVISFSGGGMFKGGFRVYRYRLLDALCTYNFYLVFGVPIIQIRHDDSPRWGYVGTGIATLAVIYRFGNTMSGPPESH